MGKMGGMMGGMPKMNEAQLQAMGQKAMQNGFGGAPSGLPGLGSGAPKLPGLGAGLPGLGGFGKPKK